MVIVSFSVLQEKILDGSKTRTMRPAIYGGKENQKWKRVYEKWNLPIPAQMGISLQIYWKSRSAKIVGYCCDCGDIYPLGTCCENCMTLAVRPVREGHKLFDAVLTNITRKKLGDLTEEEWQLDGFKPSIETARSAGLSWFAKTYKIPVENPNLTKLGFPDYYNPALLAFEVYIIEFRRV